MKITQRKQLKLQSMPKLLLVVSTENPFTHFVVGCCRIRGAVAEQCLVSREL